MDEVPTLAFAPMVVVRICLACTSPTRAPSGAYSTLVAVTEEAYASGDHLRIAAARAALLGYGGPHHVLEARRVDGGPVRQEDRDRDGSALGPARPLRARLLSAIPAEHAPAQGIAAQADDARASARRTRVRVPG